MAQVDTSIYQNYQAPKIASPFENANMLAQIQQGQAQNRLAQMKFAEAERETERANALSGLAKQYGNTPEYANRLMDGGFAKEAQEQEDYVQKRATAKTTGQKAQIENGLKQFEAVGQIMSGVSDQPSYDVARQQIAQILGPDAAANIQPVYDPAVIEQGRAKAMGIKDQLEQKWRQLDAANKERDFGLNADKFAYQQKHDSATLAQQRETSMRTDSRARDFNATKVEENTLKREAKADTANLTKQSQVASFDTMIGTLDRIGSHPGLARSVGVTGAFPTMPGSDSANFQAELETFQSQAFIPMVSQLKGMGALSDAEGKKLTAAVGALNPKMGEKAFRESVARITSDMKAAKARVSGTANQSNQQEGQTAMSKSGKPMVMRNGRWEYK